MSPTQSTLGSIIITLIGLINLLVWILSGIALVVFMFGLVRFVYHGADQAAHKQGKQLIIWGLLSLFIIFSLGAVVDLMCTTFLGSACTQGKSFSEPQGSAGGTMPVFPNPGNTPPNTNQYEPQTLTP